MVSERGYPVRAVRSLSDEAVKRSRACLSSLRRLFSVRRAVSMSLSMVTRVARASVWARWSSYVGGLYCGWGGYGFVSKVVAEGERSEPDRLVNGRLLAGGKPAGMGIGLVAPGPVRTTGDPTEETGRECRRREDSPRASRWGLGFEENMLPRPSWWGSELEENMVVGLCVEVHSSKLSRFWWLVCARMDSDMLGVLSGCSTATVKKQAGKHGDQGGLEIPSMGWSFPSVDIIPTLPARSSR